VCYYFYNVKSLKKTQAHSELFKYYFNLFTEKRAGRVNGQSEWTVGYKKMVERKLVDSPWVKCTLQYKYFIGRNGGSKSVRKVFLYIEVDATVP
jgi:hypothetical protein